MSDDNPLKQLNDVQVSLTVYALRPESTLDHPDYNFVSQEDIILQKSDFSSFKQLYEAIMQNSNTGYLKLQYFRLAFDDKIDKNQFISQDQISSIDLTKTVGFVAVKYSKQQTCHLRKLMTESDQKELDDLNSLKQSRPQPPRKIVSFAQNACFLLNKAPLTIEEAMMRIQRMGSFEPNVLQMLAVYLHCDLIDLKDILQLSEADCSSILPVPQLNNQFIGQMTEIEVPVHLVPKVQKMVADRRCSEVVTLFREMMSNTNDSNKTVKQ